MIEVKGKSSFVAIMRDPKTGKEKTYTSMDEAIQAEKDGMKLVCCRGVRFTF